MARTAEPGTQTAEQIVEAVERFLAEHPACSLLEGGETLFALSEAQYSLECAQGRAVLHVWSAERNQVRRLVGAERRGRVLRLQALRFGASEPRSMELVSEAGRRPAGGSARERYLQLLRRVLTREFPEMPVRDLRATMDLEHSFGAVYARGQQGAGQRGWAVIGVPEGESAAMTDGVLTAGILWLAHCRERSGGRTVVEGLRLIVPVGTGLTTLSRLAWMDSRIAKYALYELDEATETLTLQDPRDRGNLRTRLLPASEVETATGPGGRFAEAIPRVLALLPERPRGVMEVLPTAHRRERLLPGEDEGFEMRLRSNAELAFLRHGLEFARIRCGFQGESFNRALDVTVGAGAEETVLTEANTAALRSMVHALFARRTVHAEIRGQQTRELTDARDPLFRMQPERWLESLLRADLTALDTNLRKAPVYVQVPAIAGAGDRGMLDLLAVTETHRLAVIEVKAKEDLQFAMQGLDYWIRVRDHHLGHVDAATGLGDLQRHGYFPTLRLLAEPPMLYLVAPALHIHSATETVLRHFDPQVAWTLIALDERWRTRVRPVWRRHSGRARAAS